MSEITRAKAAICITDIYKKRRRLTYLFTYQRHIGDNYSVYRNSCKNYCTLYVEKVTPTFLFVSAHRQTKNAYIPTWLAHDHIAASLASRPRSDPRQQIGSTLQSSALRSHRPKVNTQEL